MFATVIAMVLEELGSALLGSVYAENSLPYNVIMYFVIVAFSEEGAKYILLRRRTWRSDAFNCQFDGVVYAVFVSLGFALWENLGYVAMYGLSTALVRAVTAVPGHACFGVFMGVYYGRAKRYDNDGDFVKAKRCRTMAVLMPALLHGAYDFIATMEDPNCEWMFLVFVLALFAVSLKLVRVGSRSDRYIDGGKMFPMWRDLHLRVTGPAVAALQQSFAVDWNFMGHPLLVDEIRPERQPHSNIGMQLVTGGPTTQWMNMTLIFQRAISEAKKCVYILTPYFIPTEGLVQTLQVAALSKVDVRLIVPRRSDSDMLRWATCSYVQECLRAGIKVYFYEKGMLHSKAVIIDDDFCTVGSTNFDFRSFEHNFEANMLIYSTEFNARMKALFMRELHDSRRITSAEWNRRPFLEKALESVMRLLSPIL